MLTDLTEEYKPTCIVSMEKSRADVEALCDILGNKFVTERRNTLRIAREHVEKAEKLFTELFLETKGFTPRETVDIVLKLYRSATKASTIYQGICDAIAEIYTRHTNEAKENLPEK